MKCANCGKEFGSGTNCQNCGIDRVSGLANYSGYNSPHGSNSYNPSLSWKPLHQSEVLFSHTRFFTSLHCNISDSIITQISSKIKMIS